MKQATLTNAKEFETYAKTTKKAAFLAKMEKLMPWSELCQLIEPYYPKAGNGRPPMGLERMLRMYWIANGFNLADEACEEALHDTPLFRQFCGFELDERIPDGTTLLRFRHLLEAHEIGKAMLERINELLHRHGFTLCGGSITDATLIAAPSSTKNKEKARDPEMHSVKKGKQWYFGMKVHIGSDSRSGIVHHASVTAANVPDAHEVPNLLYGNENRFYGDSAYRGKARREALRKIAPHAKDFTNKRAYRNRPLSEADKATNRRKSAVRAKVEHPFLWLKRLWGFAKVRYRGLAKNANRAFALLAAINLIRWANPLTGKVCPPLGS